MALDLSHLRVLVVDDNAFMRKLLRDLLWSLGCQLDNIHFAANGRDGLGMMRDRTFDVIFCDINMRPMDGKQFTRHVRMAPKSPAPYVPIIVCTGHAEIEHICDARDAGANEVLRKPITITNVYERIRAIVERPRPFVRSDSYHGPDRRRQDMPFQGPDRRKSDHFSV